MPGRTLTGGLVVFALAGKRLSGADGEGKPASLDQVDANDWLACYVRTRSNDGTMGNVPSSVPIRQTDMHDNLSHLPPESRVQRRLPCLELMTLLA